MKSSRFGSARDREDVIQSEYDQIKTCSKCGAKVDGLDYCKKCNRKVRPDRMAKRDERDCFDRMQGNIGARLSAGFRGEW